VQIVITGNPTPADFAEAVRKLVSRFDSIGVDYLYDVRINVGAVVEGKAVVLLNSREEIVDSMEIKGEPVEDGSSLAPPIANAAITRPIDVRRFELCAWFCDETKMPRNVQRSLVGASEQRLNALLDDFANHEFTPQERSNLGIVGRMIEAAQQLFPDQWSIIEWFQAQDSPHFYRTHERLN
jgi:hypothetical protein